MNTLSGFSPVEERWLRRWLRVRPDLDCGKDAVWTGARVKEGEFDCLYFRQIIGGRERKGWAMRITLKQIKAEVLSLERQDRTRRQRDVRNHIGAYI